MPELGDTLPVKKGDVLDGKYRVDSVLGSGGMGVVVSARHVELGTKLAVKLLRPETALDGPVVARFVREARASSRLRSEHAVRVFDVGRLKNGSPYMVMELLSGRTLGEVLEQGGPLPIADAVDYLLQACEAVAEAHALGMIHRDLKPQNLFLTRRVDGRPLVKVLDFGIAKRLTPGSEATLTRTKDVMGSPVYMSPEQMRGAKTIDARSDVWSLGVCLYELLTGRTPFEAESAPALFAKVFEAPARSVREVRADVPPPLERALMRCFEKDPAKRYANVAELARALESSMDKREAAGSAERVEGALLATHLNAPSDKPPPLSPLAETQAGLVSDSGAKRRRTQSTVLAVGSFSLAFTVALLLGLWLWHGGTKSAVGHQEEPAEAAPVASSPAAATPSVKGSDTTAQAASPPPTGSPAVSVEANRSPALPPTKSGRRRPAQGAPPEQPDAAAMTPPTFQP